MQYTAADYRRKAEDAITDHHNGRNHNGLTEANIYALLALGLAVENAETLPAGITLAPPTRHSH
ncbi:hypothetical protein [Streptomyces koyangensis]|uniref:hypothetical protein n=1 Tax=Streptomyces koyangensis TaxID=188770 RepID=UPI00378ADCD5